MKIECFLCQKEMVADDQMNDIYNCYCKGETNIRLFFVKDALNYDMWVYRVYLDMEKRFMLGMLYCLGQYGASVYAENERSLLPDVIFSFPKFNEMSFDAFGKLYEEAKRVLELRLFI
jgi:hypothetical protein